ncbi:MAG: alkaline phosphatase PhoX [Vicinamibacterales bacterium]
MLKTATLPLTLVLLLGARTAIAGPIGFENFTPLANSAPTGSLSETSPLALSSSNFVQRTISANDLGAANGGLRLGDNWDMITLNETGPNPGRYLFSPYETGSAGVRRVDLTTGVGLTIVKEGAQGFVSGDASRWTPWGTYLTGEESWGAGSTKGRLFEVTNPLADPPSINFVQRTIIPHVSLEGLAFDTSNNLYFVDELNGGAIYKYTSVTPTNGATFFNAGQTSVLKVGAGGSADATGAATWAPITTVTGAALPGIITLPGSTEIDGRAAAVAVGASRYNRPEDLEIQTLANGTQILYFAATDPTGKVFSINLSNGNTPVVSLFADRTTLKQGTGSAVGNEFTNPDNLAIDANGNIYIVEDQPGGVADIWFATDANRDGIAESLGRWASLTTAGAEPTGLYFNPFNPNVAYINVQHADSDVDRTIEITAVPEPATLGLMLTGLGMAGSRLRRRRA